MATEEKSTAPARIVRTPGTCGGRPRLEGHRLCLTWYAAQRAIYGDSTNQHILTEGWAYLRADQVQAMSDFYDANREEAERYLAEDRDVELRHPYTGPSMAELRRRKQSREAIA